MDFYLSTTNKIGITANRGGELGPSVGLLPSELEQLKQDAKSTLYNPRYANADSLLNKVLERAAVRTVFRVLVSNTKYLLYYRTKKGAI